MPTATAVSTVQSCRHVGGGGGGGGSLTRLVHFIVEQ